ncbi:hypothetical protein [Bdellovibrio sp. NC01]|uniref:hypothetical protein n=1 Tax=Bdellovibrio sp. NC01 TaxID=2220073 RepID=UPI001158C021|nr:hypothetical protein [Bdellovibrio sp. NC01]QDK37978.1 hypothetical protein DOE51_10445 [Bdellovibrio sp. NC01]
MKNYAPTNATVKGVQAEALTKIEIEMLKYILEMRYMTMDQLIRKFYDGGKVEGALKRLFDRELIKTKDKELTLESLVLLTLKGREEVVKAYPEKRLPELYSKVFPFRVNHDLHINNLRIRFEELGFLSKYISEEQLRTVPFFLREFKDLPDAVCMKANGKGYFMEMEISGKGLKQYRERMDLYSKVLKTDEMKQQQIEGVIFFCTDEKVMGDIKRALPPDTKNYSVMPYKKYFEDLKAPTPQKPKPKS